MGLDQYVHKTKDVLKPFNSEVPEDESYEEWKERQLFYWRKHPDLHGWMRQLAQEKGCEPTWNKPETWNHDFDNVTLTEADLDRLERDVENDQLPHTEGFFFGTSTLDDKEATLEFIEKAREALKEGFNLYYSHSW